MNCDIFRSQASLLDCESVIVYNIVRKCTTLKFIQDLLFAAQSTEDIAMSLKTVPAMIPKFIPRSLDIVAKATYLQCTIGVECVPPPNCPPNPTQPSTVYLSYSASNSAGLSVDPNTVLYNPPASAPLTPGSSSIVVLVQKRPNITGSINVSITATINGADITSHAIVGPPPIDPN